MKIKAYITGLAIAIAATGLTGLNVEAKSMKGLKVYINPGHGGYTSNDRPIRLHPFESNDSNGYWESKSNLYKGLHMYHILDSLGAIPYLSRTKNEEKDDRSLSGISAEANSLGCDLFFSIHSNAGENVNTPLMLYRENQIGVPRYQDNVKISQLMWKNFHSSQLPVWTRNTEYVVGDLTFYQNMWEGGLGVLRGLYVVGLLSEGSMHEHRPEAHRLMNDDVWWLEAWHIVKSIMEFYDVDDKFVTGNVAGIIYDNHNLRERIMPFINTAFGRDKLAPVNSAFVELIDAQGNVIQTRTTDNMYNGAYVFRNVAPGDYTVRVTHDDFYTETANVKVQAMEVTYNDFPMTLKRAFPLAVTKYGPLMTDGQPVSCASTIDFEFNTDIDTESFEKAFSIEPAVPGYFKYSDSYTKASFIPELSLERETNYTVTLSKDAKSPDTYYEHPNMNEDLVFSFTTRSRDRLELIDHFPADKGQVHYAAPSFELRFDYKLDSKDIYDKVTVTDTKGNKVAYNTRNSRFNQLSNNYGNAMLVVSGNLTEGETYHVKLDADIRDNENLPLGNAVEFDFTAVDASKGNEASTVFDDFETSAPFAYEEESCTGIGNVKPTASRSTTSTNRLFDKAGAYFSYQFTETHDGTIVWKYSGESHNFNTNDIFGVFVNGDFNNHEMYAGFTSGASTTYVKLCDLDFRGWQYKEVVLSELDKEFGPYTFSHIKLVQTTSPITMKGNFALDNMSYVTSDLDGATDIAADIKGVRVEAGQGSIAVKGADTTDTVSVYTTDGRLLVSTYGNASLTVPAGIYLVTVGNDSFKVSVK